MLYDVDYFIDKFSKIPEELWTVGEFTDGVRCCALGHCGVLNTCQNIDRVEVGCLRDLFWLLRAYVADVNDKQNENYQQGTPKQRILAALRDIKKQLQDGEVEKPVEVKPKTKAIIPDSLKDIIKKGEVKEGVAYLEIIKN